MRVNTIFILLGTIFLLSNCDKGPSKSPLLKSSQNLTSSSSVQPQKKESRKTSNCGNLGLPKRKIPPSQISMKPIVRVKSYSGALKSLLKQRIHSKYAYRINAKRKVKLSQEQINNFRKKQEDYLKRYILLKKRYSNQPKKLEAERVKLKKQIIYLKK